MSRLSAFFRKLRWAPALLVAVALLAGGAAWGAVLYVDDFGDGWKSDDTRESTGADLVGINYTHAGKPGQTPTAADDTAIAAKLLFLGTGDVPAGSDAGALKMILTSDPGHGGKATLSTINTTAGFKASTATTSWADDFSALYRYSNEYYNDGWATASLKLGIQSTLWSDSQSGFTATRSGEPSWDLILVYQPPHSTQGDWADASLTSTSGTWALYRQAGNSFFNSPPGASMLSGWAANTDIAKTIDSTDYTWADVLFGDGAKLTNVQFGLGSWGNGISYVDYLETSLLNGGDRINFVPEPGTLVLLAAGLVALLAYAWKRRK